MPIKIFMDCGAPSLYNKLSRKKKGKNLMGSHIKNRRRDDFSYVNTKEYKEYRRGYAEYVLKYKKSITVYPNLDVINNAELTYKNQKWLEKRGCTPLPVWHFGSDIKWLKKYIEEGYEYICIGGMVPNPTAVLKPALDRLWKDYLTDEEGMPIIKVHGFAMTSFDLMYRYPWYSVDSKSWIDYARFGVILVPILKNGKLNWLQPEKIAVSDRSVNLRDADKHIRTTSLAVRNRVLQHLESIDIPLGETDYKEEPKGYKLKEFEYWSVKPTEDETGEVEIAVERGVVNDLAMRMAVNLRLYTEIEKAVPDWPWSIRATVKDDMKSLFKL